MGVLSNKTMEAQVLTGIKEVAQEAPSGRDMGDDMSESLPPNEDALQDRLTDSHVSNATSESMEDGEITDEPMSMDESEGELPETRAPGSSTAHETNGAVPDPMVLKHPDASSAIATAFDGVSEIGIEHPDLVAAKIAPDFKDATEAKQNDDEASDISEDYEPPEPANALGGADNVRSEGSFSPAPADFPEIPILEEVSSSGDESGYEAGNVLVSPEDITNSAAMQSPTKSFSDIQTPERTPTIIDHERALSIGTSNDLLLEVRLILEEDADTDVSRNLSRLMS